MTLLTYLYIFVEVDEVARELGGYGIDLVALPYIGFFLMGGSFLTVTVLRAIPGLNQTRGQGGGTVTEA